MTRELALELTEATPLPGEQEYTLRSTFSCLVRTGVVKNVRTGPLAWGKQSKGVFADEVSIADTQMSSRVKFNQALFYKDVQVTGVLSNASETTDTQKDIEFEASKDFSRLPTSSCWPSDEETRKVRKAKALKYDDGWRIEYTPE